MGWIVRVLADPDYLGPTFERRHRREHQRDGHLIADEDGHVRDAVEPTDAQVRRPGRGDGAFDIV